MAGNELKLLARIENLELAVLILTRACSEHPQVQYHLNRARKEFQPAVDVEHSYSPIVAFNDSEPGDDDR